MERTLSIEEKIRRAEEIYARRQEGNQRKTTTVRINKEEKKDIKLLRKMIIQIIISLSIYLVVYTIQNSNYIFSEDFIKKTNEILSYDMNFVQIYENVKQNIEVYIEKIKNQNQDGAIGGAEENIVGENNENNENQENTEGQNNEENVINNEQGNNGQESNNEENKEQGNVEISIQQENQPTEPVKELTQEEQDIENIKKTTTFIKPVVGTISSKFGQREPTTSSVPKNHTGTDIASNLGTKIISATDGEVVLASEEGDYGKHLKIQIGDVSIIYAHCNSLYVKQGDKVTQGQEIAEVGSTGNSTGPHLHFEVRISERKIDPQKILEL